MLSRLSWRSCASRSQAQLHTAPHQFRSISSQTSRSILSVQQNGLAARQFPRRNIPQRFHRRPQSSFSRFREHYREAKSDVWDRHPIGFPVSVLFAVGTVSLLLYVIYDHYVNVEPQYARYPKQVADPLRRAVYYTDVDHNPVRALQWYKHALIAAGELGLNPYSDEILGIRLRISSMLENAGLVKAATEILVKTQVDCLGWVEDGRRKQTLREQQRASGLKDGKINGDDNGIQEEQRKEAAEEQLRAEVMKKVAGMGIKLAELYSSDYVRDTGKAEQALIDAVGYSRAELQRRRDLDLPVSGEQGKKTINLTEVASAYNDLADLYVGKGRNDLATVLYMQSLNLIKEEEQDGPSTCAQVLLLNNISSQMAQQAQKLPVSTARSASASTAATSPASSVTSRAQALEAASAWALKALDVAAHIKAPVRTADCDMSCQIATYNLGEIAEMSNNIDEAKKYYREAKEIGKKIQFKEGADRAEEALQRVTKGQV